MMLDGVSKGDLGNRMEAQIEKIQEMFNKDMEELKNKKE